MLDRDAVLAALARVVDPCSIATGVPVSLPDMGMVKAIDIADGCVTITLRVTSPSCWQAAHIMAKAEECVAEIAGCKQAICQLDPAWDWMPDMMSPAARDRLHSRRESLAQVSTGR